MADVAKIGIEVDATQVTAAADAMERLARAAERVAAAFEKIGESSLVVERVGDVERITVSVAN